MKVAATLLLLTGFWAGSPASADPVDGAPSAPTTPAGSPSGPDGAASAAGGQKGPAASAGDSGDGAGDEPVADRPVKSKKVKGKRGAREKEIEGTEARDRFQADTVLKSKYQLRGEQLEVDPD